MNRKHWRCGYEDCKAFGFVDFEGEVDVAWLVQTVGQDHEIQKPDCPAGIGEIEISLTQSSDAMDPVADIKLFADGVEIDDGVRVTWYDLWLRDDLWSRYH